MNTASNDTSLEDVVKVLARIGILASVEHPGYIRVSVLFNESKHYTAKLACGFADGYFG